ncbi:metal ABC transporter solute-binding protein, Zn/Mn family [Gracilibacillus phocaeensis]|uniref:metal ABC transporter solute-binding protein, Zn/Mn family n=1 Tax=Gracilibacillus phocaeensis TaxID=2042304 RepID=UPI0010324C2D|nr:zinc ABC transporter substrate-binding protein [Gracilibacillus phocaeensis]
MNKKWLYTLLLSLITAAVLVACQSEDNADNEEGEISVVASFLPMYEFTQQVAGDRADVQLMLSEGQDAHQYEPSAQDVATVNEADVFVYSSEEMEFWAESLLNTVENENLVVARAADGIENHEGEAGHDHEGHDHEGHDHENEGNSDAQASVSIEGQADHYHTGDQIELTANLSEVVDYDHWHWYQRTSEEEEWEAVPDQGTASFSLEAPEESFEVQAVLYDEDHNVYAESEPVELAIDNHEGHDHGEEADHAEEEHAHDEEAEHDHGDEAEHNHSDDEGHDHEGHVDSETGEAEESLDISGLSDHYHTGDVVTLVAELNEDTDYDHWHWFMREDADHEWEAVPDQTTDHFEYQTTGESFEVRAVLYDGDHNAYAESEPVSVVIDDHEGQDPHIWLDPVLAQDQVAVIRDALIEADPDGQEIYEENAEAFIEELQALDQDYQDAFADAQHRAFVVQHQAFGYLANRYDLEQIAIGGLSTEVEPSPSRMAEIGDLVNQHDVPVIYYQQGANSSIAQTIADETETETEALYDLEVYSEELKEADLGYLEAMQHNLEALQISIN